MIKISSDGTSSGLDDFVKDGELKTFYLMFSDLDRYRSDKYELEITMRETRDDYSLSCVAFNSHIGIMCFTRYWHYKKRELSEANKTFDTLKKTAVQVRDRFEYEKFPPVLIANHLVTAFKDLDPDHREAYYIPSVNYSRKETYTEDIRENLYGNRYPEANIINHREGVFFEQQKEVTTKNTGRQQTKHYE